MKSTFLTRAALCGAVFLSLPVAGASVDGWNGWRDPNRFSVQEDWIVAQGSSGNFLSILPMETPVDTGGQGTLHLKFRIEAGGDPDLSIGYAAADVEELVRLNARDSADAFGPMVRIVDRRIEIHTGTEFVPAMENLKEEHSYELWITALNGEDRWELRWRAVEGADPQPVSVKGQTRFAFRGAKGEAPLRSILLRANNGNSPKASVLLRILNPHLPTPPKAYELP